MGAKKNRTLQTHKTHFEIGTDNKLVRVMNIEHGKKRMQWAVKEGETYRHVPLNHVEMR